VFFFVTSKISPGVKTGPDL